MQSKAATVQAYLAELPPDRRAAIQTVREVVRRNLDKDFEEGMQYGMIGYYVPHRVYPAGYHCDPRQPLPYAGLASQKNHMSIYLMSVYGDTEEWFRRRWASTGKKLDMGKCCVRFRKLDDLPLDVIAEAIRRVPVKKFIEYYERAIRAPRGKPAKGAKPARSARTAKPAAKAARVAKKKAPNRKSR